MSGDVAVEAEMRRKEVAFRKVCDLQRKHLWYQFARVCPRHGNFSIMP